MLTLAVLVSGSGTNLQALIDAGGLPARIALVASDTPDAYALERSKKADLSHICLNRRAIGQPAFEARLTEALLLYRVELIVLAGFLTILSKGFVSRFKDRIINIHPSLIPSFCGKGYYGIKVHEAALARGVKITGATVHYVDEGTDTGRIILQKAVDVLPDDTPEVLQKRVMEQAEWVILPEAVKLIAEAKA
jgi:phosphoribosylglycinamide formyltransferase-1